MKKVFILTNFSGYLKSYSPIHVVEAQLKMLTRAGYEPTLITSQDWDPPAESIYAKVKTERIYPALVSDNAKVDQFFHEEVDLLYNDINKILEDDSVVLTHDLIFLPDYVKHNVACRKIATERPSIRWVHMVHSATGPGTLIQEREMYGEKYKELLTSKFPNSIVIYPNAEHIPRVALNFGYEEFEVFEVPHAIDPTRGMSNLVKRLYDEKELGEVDVLMIYPARLDRGKSPEQNIKVIAGCKRAGLTAHIVFCDFQSTGGDKVTLREDCKKLAKDLGVAHDVTFLSEFDDSAFMEVDPEIILELFTLSNFFCLPSRSETFSLITAEAMSRGNLCFLNADFPPFKQIYGNKALYRQFNGAEISTDGFDGKIDTTHSDEDDYFEKRFGVAFKAWLTNEKVLNGKTWVRTRLNPDAVFRNHLEPLLYWNQNE